MSTKRLIAAALIVAIILGSIGILFFQVGADEQLMSTVLPRVEQRLGLKITYLESGASLTGLTLHDLQIRTARNDALLAVIKTLEIGFRIGSLLRGKLDVTGVRILGLDARIGRKAGGASLLDWAQMVTQFLQTKNRLARVRRNKTEFELRLENSKVHFDDGRLTFIADGIAGTFSPAAPPSLHVAKYQLRNAAIDILTGGGLNAEYRREDNLLIVDADGPVFNLPVAREDLETLALDISKSVVHTRNLIAKKRLSHETGDSPVTLSSLENKKLNFTIRNGTASFKDRSSADKRFDVTGIQAEIDADTQGKFQAQLSGLAPSSRNRFQATMLGTRDSTPKIKLELPVTQIGDFASLLPLGEAFKWKDATVSGIIELQFHPSWMRSDIDGELAISDLTVSHKRLATSPLERLDFQIAFQANYQHRNGSLHFDKLRISRGRAAAEIDGDIQLSQLKFDLHLKIPLTPCNRLLAAIPRPLKYKMRKAKVGGLFGLDLHLSVDEDKPDDTVFNADVGNRCHFEDYGNLPGANFFKGPFAYVAYTGQKDNLRLITGPGTDRWASLHFISPYVIEAVITTEDTKFWTHDGVTLPEVKRSIIANLKKKTLKHGASTITMQLAKNLFLSRERTIARKLQELFYVWYLESHFKKREILELYLNIVEFGPSIYGIRDAAGYYFGREPSDLSLLESVFLVKLLPAPIPRHAIYERGYLKERNLTMLYRALATMRARKRITEFEYKEALNQEIVFHKHGQSLPVSRLPVRRVPAGRVGREPTQRTAEYLSTAAPLPQARTSF